MAELFAGKEWQTFLQILPTIPFETWETVWSTVVATLLVVLVQILQTVGTKLAIKCDKRIQK